MRREAHIPLFLWIATALVVHAIGGGGVTKVAERLEESLDIKSFAKLVRRQASYAGPPVEVTLLDDEQSLDALLEPDNEEDPDKTDEQPAEEVDEAVAPLEEKTEEETTEDKKK